MLPPKMIYMKDSKYRRDLLSFPTYGEILYMCRGIMISDDDLPRFMLHDEKLYKNPFTFNPDRFMPKNGTPEMDPHNCAFGFGRR
jgi:hypothetical protein